MVKDNIFDDVHDCQESFRLLLYAASNPGEIVCIKEYAEKLREEDEVMLTLALTLLDKETSFWVVGSEAFAKTVAELTYSKPAEEKADFIFVIEKCSRELIAGIFRRANPGSLVEPHTNSVLIIAVDGFEESASCCLKGPGINALKQAVLPEYAKQWIVQRDLMEYEYPTGVDIYFVSSKGEIMAIPRKVRMEG